MRKRLLAMLLTGAMVFSLTACGGSTDGTAAEGGAQSAEGGSTGGETVKVGFVVKSLSDQFYVLMKAGAEAEAKKMGNVELKFIAPNSESDVQGQVDMIQNLVGQKMDAICVAPSSQDAVLPVLQQADDAGIKILAVDTDSVFEKKLTFIGTGNTPAAKLGGEYVCSQFPAGSKAVILRGRLGDTNHDERQAGWEEALKAGGIEILEVQAADSQAEKALNVTQDLLAKYGDIDVICTTADSMAQGAQSAVDAAGAKTKVMGFDGTIPVAEGTAEGTYMGTVAQDPYNMGVVGVQEAVKAAQGETIENRIDTGAIVVTKDTAADFVADIKSKVGE